MKPLLLVLPLLLLLAPARAQNDRAALPELLPRGLEVELALSAVPPHLRAEAAVYALERGGYVKAREGTNGFSCLVRRNGAVPGPFYDTIAPTCYDREGSGTLLPAVLDEIRLLEQGKSNEEVAAAIEKGWKEGRYQVPGPGVSYMLSPVFRLNGRDDFYVPHVMFYGPYKTNEDVGSAAERFGYMPFMQAPGSPAAMMVLPAGEQERAAIAEQERDLIARVERYLNR